MIVHVYTICRNERTILPYFLRHYEAFADKIFCCDDRSDDGSRELLYESAKTVVYDPDIQGIDDEYFRAVYQTHYRAHSRGVADWVLCVDADEFIYHPDILLVLASCQRAGYDLLYPEGWNMFAAEPPTGPGQITDLIRTGVRDRWFDKPVIFRPYIDIRFMLGRHGCHPMPGVRKNRQSGLKLLHYRCLGKDYCAARHQRNYARFATDALRERHGKHVTGEVHLHSLAWYEDHLDALETCV